MSLFRLILISAWNDSGGQYLARLFDGHSALWSYPFELQLGTGYRHDSFSAYFKDKYRWPAILSGMTAREISEAIIDEERKQYLADPSGNKFGTIPFIFSQQEFLDIFDQSMENISATVQNIIPAYIHAIFCAWKNYRKSGKEQYHIGHCPNIILDTQEILKEKEIDARIIHIIRNPFGGFHDAQMRNGISVADYLYRYNLVNTSAYLYSNMYSDRIFIVRYEDLLISPKTTIESICAFLDIPFEDCIMIPTWNQTPIEEFDITHMGPFGGVRQIGHDYEAYAHNSLGGLVCRELMQKTMFLFDMYGYQDLLSWINRG